VQYESIIIQINLIINLPGQVSHNIASGDYIHLAIVSYGLYTLEGVSWFAKLPTSF